MKNSPARRLAATLAALFLAVGLTACPNKRRPNLAAPPPPEPSMPVDTTTPTSPVEPGPDVRPIGGESASGSDIAAMDAAAAEAEGGPLADIHFDYDSAALSDGARKTLEAHVVWLQSHREAQLTVEGHCDDIGSDEYNLALGAKRAQSAKDFLVSQGIPPDRLVTISYGKEKPQCTEATEDCYQRNRRAHFTLAQ